MNLSVTTCKFFYSFPTFEPHNYFQPEFVVGYGCKDYPNYRRLTKAELHKHAIRIRLIELHSQFMGWPLAESTLVVKERLCVADGWVNMDGWWVTVVGKVPGEDLSIRGVYTAMTRNTNIVWTTTPPPQDATWGVDKTEIEDWPCLFVRLPVSTRIFTQFPTRILQIINFNSANYRVVLQE